jgi:transposase
MDIQGKRVYYGQTTEQQRRHMIEVYESTGNKSEACRQAKVSRGTFYRWYPRYEEGGWEALKECKSSAPHTHSNAKPLEIVEQVLELNEEHPDWGRQRIANQINKEHNWEKVIGASAVRDILVREGRWPRQGSEEAMEVESASPKAKSR